MKLQQINDKKTSGKRVFGLVTAISLVIANMIGTGLFTTTGFLVEEMQNSLSVLLLWFVGGIFALSGALTYGEIGANLPRSGGEYHYLSQLIHPIAGFLAGWISLIVGFSAPVAAVSIAFAKYLNSVFEFLPVMMLAIGAIVLFSGLHLWNVKAGSKVQNIITAMKVLLILLFVAGGLWLSPGKSLNSMSNGFQPESVFSPAFAVGLVFVMYAYSGWNATSYIAGELKKPTKNLPIALFTGTFIVLVLYMAVNYFFLTIVPAHTISGKIEVGHYVAAELFGSKGGNIISILIAFFLLSALSAMIMAGPRVYQVIGEDYPWFKKLSRVSSKGAPVYAILLQMIIAIIMVVTFAFDTILVYVGFTLSLVSGLTVAGVFVLRKRLPEKENKFKVPGYPLTPLIFLIIAAWMVVHALVERPLAAIAGIVTLSLGVVVFYLSRNKV